MKQKVESACRDFIHYHQAILRPAAEEFDSRLSARSLRLHHVIQINMLAAHMLDYLVEIRKAMRQAKDRDRLVLVREFDDRFAVRGARFLNRNFQLVDAVNNAVKHVALDGRYEDVFSQYGKINFRCLREDDGLVLFEGAGYRFDFSRVVLRPVLAVVVPLSFDAVEHVAEFATNGAADMVTTNERDEDPIDQMISYCNRSCPGCGEPDCAGCNEPSCLDCGEGEDECQCSEFFYAGKQGEFRPTQDEKFDFDAVMTRISGAYRRG
jgi:hypothetical protein